MLCLPLLKTLVEAMIEIQRTIKEFLGYVLSGKEGASDLNELAIHLDKLAYCIHQVNYKFDEADYPDAPDRNYAESRAIVEKRFPYLGYYNVVEDISENIESTKVLVGDSIDDLVDIAGDLQDVLWYFENTSNDDALWHFRNSYISHWGRHLRDLQLYLHDKVW